MKENEVRDWSKLYFSFGKNDVFFAFFEGSSVFLYFQKIDTFVLFSFLAGKQKTVLSLCHRDA